MRKGISRRAVLGGTMALAGASAFCGLAVVDGLKVRADEELIVGFAKAKPVLQVEQFTNWRWLVSDDGRDNIPFWCQPGCFADAEHFEHGARVWAARVRSDADARLHRRMRILRVAPAGSIEASSARYEAHRRAWGNGQWVNARVLPPVSATSRERIVRCELPDGTDGRTFMRVRAVGALSTAQRYEPLLLKVGKTWEGWHVFEARTIEDALNFDV